MDANLWVEVLAAAMKKAPGHVMEIFLQPGEFFFGDKDIRIRTILGSCVAVVLWHPRYLIGGMCHYMLPGNRKIRRGNELDGKYADDAMLLFMQELKKTGTQPQDYVVKMFGGGDQFPGKPKAAAMSVPARNVESGHQLLAYHGFTLNADHLGGSGHRNVVFDIWSGDAWVKHVSKGHA
jgi:chemotaxis protein CheD